MQATAALEHATALRRNAQLRLLAKSLLPPQQAESIQHHVKFLMAQHTYLAKARQHMPGYVEAYEEHLQREAQLTAAVQQEISRLAPPRGLGPGSGLGTGPQGASQPALKPGGLKADPASPKAQLGQLQQQGQLDHGVAHLNGTHQQQGGQQQQALQQPLLQHQQGAQRQSKVDQAFWPELAQQLHPAQQQPLTVSDPPQHPHLHQPPPQGAAETTLAPSHTWQQVALPDGRMALVPVHSPANPAASSLLHPYPPASSPDLPSLAHAPSTPHPPTSTATATVPLSLTITLTHSAPAHPSTLTASPGWPGLQPMTSPPPHLQAWGQGAGPYTHPPALASWPPPPQQPMLPGLAHQSLQQQQQQVRQQPGEPGGWSVSPPGPAATRLPGGGVGWGPGPPSGPSPPWRPAWAPGSPDRNTWGQPPRPPPPMSMAQQQTQAMGPIQLPGPGPGLQQLHSGWYDQGWGWPGAPPAGQEGARWQQVLATGQGQGAAAPAWQLLGMEGPPATWAPPDWRPAASNPYVSQGLSQGQPGGGWGGWGQPASPGGGGMGPEGPYPPYPPPWLQPPSSPQPPAVHPPQPPHQAHPTPPLQSEQSAQQQEQLPGAQPAPRAPGPGFPQQPPQDTTPPAGLPSPSLPLHPLPTPLPSPPPSPPGLPAPTPAPSFPSAGPAAAAGPSPSLPKGLASAQPGAAVDPASGSSGAEGHAQAGATPQAQVAASSSNGRQGEVPSKQGRGKPGSPRGSRHPQGDGPGTGGTGNGGGGGGGGGGGLWGALSVVQEAAEVKSSSSSSSSGSAASGSAASQPAVLSALGSTPSLPSRVPSSRSSSEHSSDQRQRVSSRHSGGSHSPSSTSTLGGAGPPRPRPASPAALLRPSLPGLQLLPGEALGRGSQAEPPSPWQHVGRLGLRGGPQEEDAISIGSTVKTMLPGRLGGRVRAADVVAAGLAAVRSSAAPAGLPPQHEVLERSLPRPFPSDSPRASMAVTWAGGLFTVQKGDSSHDSGDWSHPGGSLEAQPHISHHPVLLAQGDPRGAARVRYLTRDDSIPCPEPAAASASASTIPAHASNSTSSAAFPIGAPGAGSGTSTSATTAAALSIPPPSALTPGMTSASAPPSTLNTPHTPRSQPPVPAASEATTMPDSQHRPGAAAASGPSQLDTVRGSSTAVQQQRSSITGNRAATKQQHSSRPGHSKSNTLVMAEGQQPALSCSACHACHVSARPQHDATTPHKGELNSQQPCLLRSSAVQAPDDDEVAHELDAAAVQLERAMAAAAAAQAKRGAARPKPALLGSLLVGLEEGLDGGRPGAAATDLMSSRSGPQPPLLRISSSSLAVSSSQPSGPSRTTITGSTSQLTVHHPGLGPRFTSSGSGNGSAAHLDSGLISQDTTRQPSNTHPRSHSGSGLLAPAAAIATRPSSNNSMLAPPASQQQQGAMGGASSSFAPKQATKGLHWGNQSLQPKAAAASTSNSGSASLGKQLSHQPGLLAGSGSKVSGGSLTRGASASQAAAASVSRQSSGLAPAQSTAGSKAGVGRIIHQVLNTDNDFGDSSDDSDFSAHPLPHHRDNRMTGDSGESSEHDFGGNRPHGGQGGVSGSRHGSGGDGRGNLQSGMPARRMAMSGSLLSGSFDTDF
ncbi:hypothetical protein QJQ45_008939 [Haematococcus lacustris]|nr:hypothetical protein QJQ45_008939 [Haematococcus lacustris]